LAPFDLWCRLENDFGKINNKINHASSTLRTDVPHPTDITRRLFKVFITAMRLVIIVHLLPATGAEPVR
jgi:hypothetical protein